MTFSNSALERLQNWYLLNCDGDWEHSWGISISTLDNPGFTIKINLEDTPLEDLEFERSYDISDYDWLFIKTKDKVFEASCSPLNLENILNIFLDEVIPNYGNPDFEYEIYIPLKGGPTKIWRPVKAKLVSEDSLQIISIPNLEYRDIKTITLDDLTFEEEDIYNYIPAFSLGDIIKVELLDLNGTTIVSKE
jgi:hypothetical protein